MQLHIPWFKPAAWGVVGGAVGTMIIGFSWLGWTLGSIAERMAVERTSSAVKLAVFQKIDSWKQREAGVATAGSHMSDDGSHRGSLTKESGL